MSVNLSPDIHLTESGDEFPSKNVLEDQNHNLAVTINENNKYIYLQFSSRDAMYNFALSLLHESVFGVTGMKEYFPLKSKGELMVVDGVRLTLDSSRVFVDYPINKIESTE